MTELETAIAVVGTLGGTLLGTVLGYILDQRRELMRVKRQVALGPLQDRREALKPVFDVLAEIMITFSSALTNPQENAKAFSGSVERFKIVVSRAVLWCSKDSAYPLMEAWSAAMSMSTRLTAGRTPSEEQTAKMLSDLGYAAAAVDKDLGIDLLRIQFDAIARTFRTSAKS